MGLYRIEAMQPDSGGAPLWVVLLVTDDGDQMPQGVYRTLDAAERSIREVDNLPPLPDVTAHVDELPDVPQFVPTSADYGELWEKYVSCRDALIEVVRAWKDAGCYGLVCRNPPGSVAFAKAIGIARILVEDS